MSFLFKMITIVRILTKSRKDEKVDSDTPKRHRHHLFAAGMDWQAIGVHFAPSVGKRRISCRVGVYFRNSGGKYRLQCKTLPPSSKTEEEAFEKNEEIQEPVLVGQRNCLNQWRLAPIRCMNSWRVFSFLRKAPVNSDVVVTEFCF